MLFSIITVTLNAGAVIKRTLDSIACQSFRSFELIIVDGESSDDTIDLCQEYAHIITRIVVERDGGIYDAMNKGLNLAKGDYCLFLNAGDELYSDDTLSQVTNSITDECVILSGDFLSISAGGYQRYIQTNRLTMSHLRKDFNGCHQSIYIKRSHIQQYNLRYKFLADYDAVIRAVDGCRPDQVLYVSLPLCKYYRGGFSDSASILREIERYRIQLFHFGFLRLIFNLPQNSVRLLKGLVQ